MYSEDSIFILLHLIQCNNNNDSNNNNDNFLLQLFIIEKNAKQCSYNLFLY